MKFERNEPPLGLSGVRYPIFLIALWAIPIAVLVASLNLAATLERNAVVVEGPLTVPVGEQIDDRRQPVTVIAVRSPGTAVVSRLDGLVTSVQETALGDVRPGSPLVRIDDILVRAQPGESPLVADVTPDARGSDIMRVIELLGASGYEVQGASQDRYSAALRDAINAWNADAGLPRDGVFRTASTAYVPVSVREMVSFSVNVGDRVAEDEPIVTGQAAVDSVRFESVSEQPLTDYGESPVVLLIGSESIPVAFGELGGEPARALFEKLVMATDADVVTAAEDGMTTRFSSVFVALAEPIISATVPSSAIYVEPDGRQCVFVVDRAEADNDEAVINQARPRMLANTEPLLGSASITAVDSALAGATVVADIAALPEGVTCELTS